MATDDTIPGNRSKRSIIGNVSFAIVIAFFILCAVLTLDAYKFISFRQAKFARKRIISALAYMPPETIESHTGMKVMTNDEYTTLMTKLFNGRKEIIELLRKERSHITELNKLNADTATMKADIELLKEFLAKSTTNTTTDTKKENVSSQETG